MRVRAERHDVAGIRLDVPASRMGKDEGLGQPTARLDDARAVALPLNDAHFSAEQLGPNRAGHDHLPPQGYAGSISAPGPAPSPGSSSRRSRTRKPSASSSPSR